MKQAAARIDEAVEKFRKRADQLTVADTEGDAELYSEVQSILWLVGEWLVLRYSYLKIVPWSFSNADTPAGAAAFLAGVRSRPLAEHDPLTQYLFETHRVDLDELAAQAGDDWVCSAALSGEVDIVNETPLDESAGEGYHRSTHHTRVRASGAKSPYIKESTRRKENIKMLRYWLKMGQEGRRVLRYEWRNWTRILQTNPRHVWRSKRLQKRQVFERVYRMDTSNEFDWSQVCERIHAPGQGSTHVPEPEPGLGAAEKFDKATHDLHGMRIEYLLDVLQPLKSYSMNVPRADMDSSGRPVEVVETKYFQLLAVTHSGSRPELMPTIESHKHVTHRSRLSLNTQEFSAAPWVLGVDAAEGSALVYPNGNPQWVDWKDLAVFSILRTTLRVFRTSMGSETNPGCIVLSDPILAVPQHALTDMKCPALMFLSELYTRGWRPIRGRVVHESIEPGFMDSREAVRMKSYYMVLLKLPQCLPLSARIPSDQPILFYKLLLRGISTSPGLGEKAYKAIAAGKPIAAPPLEDDDMGLEFSGRPKAALCDTEHLVVGPGGDGDPRGEVTPPKPKAHSGGPLPIAGGPTGPGSSDEPLPLGKAPSPGPLPKVASKVPPPKAVSKAPPPPEIEFPLVGPRPGGPPIRTPREPKKWKNAIGGGRCSFKEYVQPSGKVYANWTMECPHCPKIDHCERVLGVYKKTTTPLGHLQPLAFLHVWKELEPGPPSHRKTDPESDDQVFAFFTEHKEELEEIWTAFAAP